MSETTPQSYAAFLESLKVKNEGQEELNGWRFDIPLKDFKDEVYNDSRASWCPIAYLFERCRRAESNAKPPDLAEQVKKFMRAGMDAKPISDWMEFRRLSELGES